MLQLKAFNVVVTEELFKLVLKYCMASTKMYLQSERIAVQHSLQCFFFIYLFIFLLLLFFFLCMYVCM